MHTTVKKAVTIALSFIAIPGSIYGCIEFYNYFFSEPAETKINAGLAAIHKEVATHPYPIAPLYFFADCKSPDSKLAISVPREGSYKAIKHFNDQISKLDSEIYYLHININKDALCMNGDLRKRAEINNPENPNHSIKIGYTRSATEAAGIRVHGQHLEAASKQLNRLFSIESIDPVGWRFNFIWTDDEPNAFVNFVDDGDYFLISGLFSRVPGTGSEIVNDFFPVREELVQQKRFDKTQEELKAVHAELIRIGLAY